MPVVWNELNKPRISGWNSGLVRARIAGHLFLSGNGMVTTQPALRLVELLHEVGIIGEDFNAAAYGVRLFRNLKASKKASWIALRDKERGKVVSAVKKRFGVDIDSPDFDIAVALERIESKVGK